VLEVDGRRYPCLLGKNGRTHCKREGDGNSPVGRWKLGQLFYRPDKMLHFRNGKPLKTTDGWCDAKGHRLYNRPVTLPFDASHEEMWRKDEAYDLVCLTGHNQRPRVHGLGSAIFLHVWRPGATGTEGCVALRASDLRKLLARLHRKTYLVI
jgi:L,D-peptidoglycan transpeptidase YkuD (ErfK/YbiS/YcfS/YnhG family)